MQWNHVSSTTNALPRQIAARLFWVTLTYVTSKKAKLFDFHLTLTTTKQKPQILARFSGV